MSLLRCKIYFGASTEEAASRDTCYLSQRLFLDEPITVYWDSILSVDDLKTLLKLAGMHAWDLYLIRINPCKWLYFNVQLPQKQTPCCDLNASQRLLQLNSPVSHCACATPGPALTSHARRHVSLSRRFKRAPLSTNHTQCWTKLFIN